MPYFRINNLKLKAFNIEEKDFIERLRKIIPDEFDLTVETIGKKNILKTNFQIGKLFEHSLGLLYVQSKSSMLSALALVPDENDKVLDLCSAPGSKTTLISELMNNTGFILANEISLDRAKALMFNTDRLGNLNITISNYDGVHLASNFVNYFDKVLVDPPCTALGDTRFTPQKQIERNLSRVENLTQIQYQLLIAAAKMLKVDGEIVYSTCTTTLEENELLINKFLMKYPFEVVEHNLKEFSNGNSTGKNIRDDLFKSIRIDPTEDEEGFFIITLKKKSDFIDDEKPQSETTKFEERIFDSDSKEVKEILQQLSYNYGIDEDYWNNFLFVIRSGDIYFTSKSDFEYSQIKFLRIGIKLASLDKKTGWRLTSNAVQIIGNEIKKNILTLETKEQLKTYFMGQKTKLNFQDSNFVVVKYGDYFIGSGKVKDSILLSYFPRSRRTIEIDFSLIQ
ncbi:MAG: hypothetical protein ACPL25_09010 [Ignavibacteria bacterium]